MISRSEVTDWAERFGVAQPQIARDHFISHVLHALGQHHPAIRFFGGTALCRSYLERSRLSEDVDLLHPEPRAFLEDLANQLPTALRREFPDTSCGSLTADGDGYAAALASPGLTSIKLYVGADGTNTRAWEFAATGVELRYSDLPATQTLQCPTLATFGAMKLSAWFDRHAPRDLFDLAGLAGLGVLADPEVHRIFREKMGVRIVDSEIERLPRATVAAWDTELGAQTGSLPTADACHAALRDALGHRTSTE
jgi:predicted nucleotidyltransferase component of viral defense system